jgi:hypothetical protein
VLRERREVMYTKDKTMEVWDANYRKWTARVGIGYGVLELYSTANGREDDTPFARHVWLRNSLLGAAYTPGNRVVRLTVPGGIYDPGDVNLHVDMRTPEDAAKLYQMARNVMFAEEGNKEVGA